MTANLNRTHEDDSDRVDFADPFEVIYWTQELGCTAAQLRAATDEVGYKVVDLRRYLSHQHSGVCRQTYHFFGK